jgi:hypothetical protein
VLGVVLDEEDVNDRDAISFRMEEPGSVDL